MSKCAVCGSKKSTVLKEQEGSKFLENIGEAIISTFVLLGEAIVKTFAS